jgi:hypothetical protein
MSKIKRAYQWSIFLSFVGFFGHYAPQALTAIDTIDNGVTEIRDRALYPGQGSQ